MPATQLAVLGHPIAHSKSPVIHRAAYRELGLDWRYSAIRCAEASLRALLAGRGPEWRGFSLTMPLKDEAHALAHTLDASARESGVANTLLRVAGGWAAFNTDVEGLARAISRTGLDATRTVVLGAGATAGSAVLAARSLGARRVTVLARRIEAARALAERFDGGAGPAGSLTVSAGVLTADHPGSAGAAVAAPLAGEPPTLVISTLPGHGVDWSELAVPAGSAPLFDVAYNPWPSAGARVWRAAGGAAHSGIDMLVEQALIQVRIFVQGSPDTPLPDEDRVLAAMREAAA
ncbi:shikimate dehydrogenase family protein [Leucobacter sp. HY1910]